MARRPPRDRSPIRRLAVLLTVAAGLLAPRIPLAGRAGGWDIVPGIGDGPRPANGGDAVVWVNLAILGALGAGANGPGLVALEIEPARAALRGPDSSAQVAVSGRSADGKLADVTDRARYSVADPAVATVDADGRIRPVGDGSTTVEVAAGGRTGSVAVVVSDCARAGPVRFAGEVVPILTRHGCNAGGCHGKSTGQNGFRLSLLGFDPGGDYDALVKEGRGRRVFPPDPGSSLLVRKPTAQVPHGGGKRFAVGSAESNTLARWIGQGMPFGPDTEPALVRVAVEPARRTIPRKGRLQLRVVAHHADGSSADVTHLAQFQSNAADLAEVDGRGVVHALDGVGEAAIMARFGGLIGVARATIPSGVDLPDRVEPPSGNFIDPPVAGKLRELGLRPSGPCTDAEFARRSTLDICGLLPEPADVVAFEADPDPGKRARWVDRLIARPEYADLFAMKWSAILRNKRTLGDLSKAGTFAFHGWIRQSLAENKPYDRFVAEIVAARGDSNSVPPVIWYRQVDTIEGRVDDTAQLFLGLRIQCARCHHHPFEQWSQDDYYGFASFFARVESGGGPDARNLTVRNRPQGLAINPITGEARKPKPLGAAELGDLGRYQDPRDELVGWLGRPDNPFFARAVVNRYWKHFLGRGLVEPEDDMRASNPPTNPELLDALADDFVRSGHDLKHLVRTIATSRAYGRSSQPDGPDAVDRRNLARFTPRRLPAEVLLDAIDTVAGSRSRFAGLPDPFRAVQLPDDGFASSFLDVFGRPRRESACECERSAEANLSQTLHLLNSDEIQARLADADGRAARLAADPRPEAAKVEGLYRVALARKPDDDERADCVAFLEGRKAAGRLREGYEDLIWTMINTKEFLFNR